MLDISYKQLVLENINPLEKTTMNTLLQRIEKYINDNEIQVNRQYWKRFIYNAVYSLKHDDNILAINNNREIICIE